MVGAEAAPGESDLLPAAAVVVDPRHDVVHDEVLETKMLPRPHLERKVLPAPAAPLEAVDAVELDPALLDEGRHRPEQPVVLEVPRLAVVGREDEHRRAVVAVGDEVRLPDRQRVQHDVGAPHLHAFRNMAGR